MTSPTGSEGHSVASPLSRAITSRCAPPSDRGPSARSSAHTTKPSSNSRTRTSRCWYPATSPLIHSSARSCAGGKVTIATSLPHRRDGHGVREAAVHHQIRHRLQLRRIAREPGQELVEVVTARQQQPLNPLGRRPRVLVTGVVERAEPDRTDPVALHLHGQQAALHEPDTQVV